MGPYTLFVVVDERGGTHSELKQLRAELHKLGERKLGTVTYCTTSCTLVALLVPKYVEEQIISPVRFPRGIVYKLDEVHGDRNFAIPLQHDFSNLAEAVHSDISCNAPISESRMQCIEVKTLPACFHSALATTWMQCSASTTLRQDIKLSRGL
jgi:hypothetical protein